MHARGESLTLLSGIGPYLNKQIIDWLRDPPELEEATPEIRNNFLTLSEARTLRTKYPERFRKIRGDCRISSRTVSRKFDTTCTIVLLCDRVEKVRQGLSHYAGMSFSKFPRHSPHAETRRNLHSFK